MWPVCVYVYVTSMSFSNINRPVQCNHRASLRISSVWLMNGIEYKRGAGTVCSHLALFEMRRYPDTLKRWQAHPRTRRRAFIYLPLKTQAKKKQKRKHRGRKRLARLRERIMSSSDFNNPLFPSFQTPAAEFQVCRLSRYGQTVKRPIYFCTAFIFFQPCFTGCVIIILHKNCHRWM